MQRETFEEYAQSVLEQYYECRTADDELFAVMEEIMAEIQSDAELIAVPLNDVDCAVALKDSVVEIYEEIAAALGTRYRAARAIRRRCQLLSEPSAVSRCWWDFRIQILFNIVDTIRDVQARRENFNRTTLALLEAYYECRVE